VGRLLALCRRLLLTTKFCQKKFNFFGVVVSVEITLREIVKISEPLFVILNLAGFDIPIHENYNEIIHNGMRNRDHLYRPPLFKVADYEMSLLPYRTFVVSSTAQSNKIILNLLFL
jgi:hypothetical protein